MWIILFTFKTYRKIGMAQYKTAFTTVSDLLTSLEQYRDNVVRKKIRKKSAIKDVASELQSDIVSAFSTTNLPELTRLRKHLKVLQTNLESIQELMQSDVKPSEAMRVFNGKFSDRIDELQVILDQSKQDLEDEDVLEKNHAKNTRTSFNKLKSKYAPKLRTRLRGGGVKFIEVPVIAQLNPQINKPKLLKELGIEHETFGLEHNTRDLGIVFKDQYLLMFDKEEAIAAAKEAQAEETKQGTAHTTREKRNTTKKLRELFGKFAQVCGYTNQTDIKEFVAEGMKIKSDDLEATLKRMFTRKIREKELRKLLAAEIQSLIGTIIEVKEKILSLDESMKPTKAKGRKRQRDIDRTNAPLISIVHQVLADIERKNGAKLSLLTDGYINNPENSKLVMFWVVPTAMYRNLTAFSSGDKMVTRWGLPWSNSKKMNK